MKPSEKPLGCGQQKLPVCIMLSDEYDRLVKGERVEHYLLMNLYGRSLVKAMHVHRQMQAIVA